LVTASIVTEDGFRLAREQAAAIRSRIRVKLEASSMASNYREEAGLNSELSGRRASG